jgi:hypothetical protein
MLENCDRLTAREIRFNENVDDVRLGSRVGGALARVF